MHATSTSHVYAKGPAADARGPGDVSFQMSEVRDGARSDVGRPVRLVEHTVTLPFDATFRLGMQE